MTAGSHDGKNGHHALQKTSSSSSLKRTLWTLWTCAGSENQPCDAPSNTSLHLDLSASSAQTAIKCHQIGLHGLNWLCHWYVYTSVLLSCCGSGSILGCSAAMDASLPKCKEKSMRSQTPKAKNKWVGGNPTKPKCIRTVYYATLCLITTLH